MSISMPQFPVPQTVKIDGKYYLKLPDGMHYYEYFKDKDNASMIEVLFSLADGSKEAYDSNFVDNINDCK